MINKKGARLKVKNSLAWVQTGSAISSTAGTSLAVDLGNVTHYSTSASAMAKQGLGTPKPAFNHKFESVPC